ncbi:hypothetical protein ACVXZZ_16865 [Staphylococcus aureus]
MLKKYMLVVHTLFYQDRRDVLKNSAIKELIVTNSIHLDDTRNHLTLKNYLLLV